MAKPSMYKISDQILEHLKCDVCSAWLSCGPVLVSPSFKSICGRCNKSNIVQNKVRHTAFEVIARFYRFPCRNWINHCPTLLEWNEAFKHEEHCLYGSGIVKYCTKPQLLFKRNRKLNLNEGLNFYDIPEDLLEQLKCYLCEGYLSCIPIVITRNGRNICHRCYTSHGAPDKKALRHISFEILLETFIFPCIYRNRGCTVKYPFGEKMWSHEIECSYGKNFKKPRNSKSKGKEKGVVETHTGHVFATLTSNKPLFAPPSEMEKQDQFLKDFKKHREILNTKWGAVSSPVSIKKKEPDITDRNDVTSIVEHFESEPSEVKIYKGVQRHSSMYGNVEIGRTIRHNLIDELKTKQKQKSDDAISIRSSGRLSQNSDCNYFYNYSNGQIKPKKYEYSVYNSKANFK